VKSLVEAILVRGGIAHYARRSYRTRTLVLAYHNIVPHAQPVTGDRSLHLTQERFAEHLHLLIRHCDVIPLDSIFADADTNRPRVAITFDDAYRGAVTVGVTELVDRGLPATIFVVPGFIGGRSFWWDEVMPAAEEEANQFRERALDEHKGRDEEVRTWAAAQGIRPRSLPEHAVTATEEELRTAAAYPGITLGSHTWSHPNLSRLDEDSVEEELTRSREWLTQRFDCFVPWLSYPYGLTSPVVERIAAATGYRAALRVSGGWLPTAGRNTFALPRLNIPAGVSPHGFTLRLSGIMRE
jgi:peptidoglycan/xylan/chitin deacetylase (PgdA/CDA1 family)